MKKLLLTATLVAIFGFAATAQEQGDIRAGAGLAIGTKAGIDDNGETKIGLGINVGAEYLATDVIGIAPSFTYFFPSSVGGADINYTSFNIDGRYYFGESGVYGLAGLGIVGQKVKGGGISVSDSETGLNLGAGIMYPMGDALFLNGQLKYNTVDLGDGAQIVINAGVAFAF